MHLRDRTVSDLPALVALLDEVYQSDGYPTVWPTHAQRWLAGSDEYGAWIAEVDGALAGHVSLGRPPEEARSALWASATARPIDQLAVVTRLFTAPTVRGAGLGRRLLHRAVQAAHERDVWPVLDVRHDGRPGAAGLYHAAGWRLVGTAPRRLGDGRDRLFDCCVGPAPR